MDRISIISVPVYFTQVMRAGVGFHYAAMEPQDRATVERLFMDRDIMVSHHGTLLGPAICDRVFSLMLLPSFLQTLTCIE